MESTSTVLAAKFHCSFRGLTGNADGLVEDEDAAAACNADEKDDDANDAEDASADNSGG